MNDMPERELCDVCGSAHRRLIAAANQYRLDTFLCEDCGLVFGLPRPTQSELEAFYDDEFGGDGGASKVSGGSVDASYVGKEERVVRSFSGPLLSKAIKLEGLDVLDIRGRTGALSDFMRVAGANVLHTDPFEANVQHAKDRRGLESRLLKLTELTGLSDWTPRRFDLVTALSVHLLAHVPSPVSVLNSFAGILKPGGRVVLDEKDVLAPMRYKNGSIFNSGIAHLHHFTTETLSNCFAAAGFKVEMCERDSQYATAFRHIKLIAQRPSGEIGRRAVAANAALAAGQRRRLYWTEKRKWLYVVGKKLGVR